MGGLLTLRDRMCIQGYKVCHTTCVREYLICIGTITYIFFISVEHGMSLKYGGLPCV